MELSDAHLQQLIEMLERRLAVIADADMRENDPEGQLAQLQEVSEAIMAFHEDHRGQIPIRLNHFLENPFRACTLVAVRDSRPTQDVAAAWSPDHHTIRSERNVRSEALRLCPRWRQQPLCPALRPHAWRQDCVQENDR